MKSEYMNHYGDDDMVVNAARVSFSKQAGEYSAEQNERLIHFLARENHFAPFTHPQITLRMKAPVSIRTQCFKHKIGFSESEESRRYIKSIPELFVPEYFREKPEGSIKQGSGGRYPYSHFVAKEYIELAQRCIEQYETWVELGVAPEQARLILPQGCQVNWVWTGSLAAFARFYNQRTDSHAQKEIQDLAKQVGEIIQPLFPVSWAALTNHAIDRRE